MRVGVSMYSYVSAVQAGRLDLVGFIREANRIGAEGVELLDFFYKNPAEERELAKSALQETGLVCGVFSVANNFAKDDPAERMVALEKIRFGIEEAVFLGAGTVRVFAGNLPPDASFGFDQARAWIVEGLIEASNIAHEKGVRLGLENHGKLAGRGDQVRGIIEDVRAACGHDTLGANPDTGNFLLVGQAGHEGVADVAHLATMVHFKDFAPRPAGHQGHVYDGLDGAKFHGTVIGEGTVDLSRCVAILREAGFDGWLNLEYEGDVDPFEGVPASLSNTYRFVRGA